MSATQKLYDTRSICPRCALLESRGAVLKDAEVVQIGAGIWIITPCERHGPQRVLVSKNTGFFKKLLSYSLKTPSTSNQPVDIEELSQFTSKKAPTHDKLPLVMELVLFNKGSFLTDEEIHKQVTDMLAMYPKTHKFILRLIGKLATDMQVLNTKILYISEILRGIPILIDLSHERMAAIADLDDSAFLKPRIFPNIKYYLRKGDERQCEEEISSTLATLREFDGIQLIITLVIEPPYPSISRLMDTLRQCYGFVRLIEFVMERPPQDVVKKVRASVIKKRQAELKVKQDIKLRKIKAREAKENGDPLGVVSQRSVPTDTIEELEPGNTYEDCMDLYTSLEWVSQVSCETKALHPITPQDFLPVTILSAFEPFISMLGYGKYMIRPSPHCAVTTCLINTSAHSSMPITQLFDGEQFYKKMQSVLPKLRKSGIGWASSRSLKKIIKESTRPGVKIPNILDYLTDKSKASETTKFAKNLQFLVVHNYMDIGNVDAVRRCNCTAQLKSKDNMFASCTGCI